MPSCQDDGSTWIRLLLLYPIWDHGHRYPLFSLQRALPAQAFFSADVVFAHCGAFGADSAFVFGRSRAGLGLSEAGITSPGGGFTVSRTRTWRPPSPNNPLLPESNTSTETASAVRPSCDNPCERASSTVDAMISSVVRAHRASLFFLGDRLFLSPPGKRLRQLARPVAAY